MTVNGKRGSGDLGFHELATIFPPMTDEEYAALKADISVRGVLQPIYVWRGEVIDGRHRYRACQELGLDPPVHYVEDHEEPEMLVLSSNMSRRHLNPGQRAIVISAFLNGGDAHKSSRITDKPTTRTRSERAAIAQVHDNTMWKADVVVEFGDQNIIEKVKNGSIYLDDAFDAVKSARLAKKQAEKAAKERLTAEREVTFLTTATKSADTRSTASAAQAAAAAAERETTEQARAEQEMTLLKAAKQRMEQDPTITKLSAALKEQRRVAALEAARSDENPVTFTDISALGSAAKTVQVGRRSRVVFTDNLDPKDGIGALPPEGVALTFTSPPYWNFVDYGYPGVGYEDSYERYIGSLARVFSAVWDKTMPGGRAVVNISNMKSRRDQEGTAFVYPIVADTIKAMVDAGFTFFDEIIWHKGNANAGALGGTPLWGSYPYPPTPKILDSTFENILVFTKAGQRSVDIGVKELSRLGVDDWRQYTKGVWNVPHDRDPHHPATFPMEVADRIIKMYSFVGDLVLDPFAGTATAVISAERNMRAGVGFEISTAYRVAVQHKERQWLTNDP